MTPPPDPTPDVTLPTDPTTPPPDPTRPSVTPRRLHPSAPDRSTLATSHRDTRQNTGLLLWQVTNRWQAAQRAALKPFGLTHVQFVLLASLTWLDTDGPVSQRRLADWAATDAMMTSQVLRALQERGYVTREPDPLDRRARAIAVTKTGRELANRAVVAVEDVDAAFFATLDDDRAAFTEALARLLGPGTSTNP